MSGDSNGDRIDSTDELFPFIFAPVCLWNDATAISRRASVLFSTLFGMFRRAMNIRATERARAEVQEGRNSGDSYCVSMQMYVRVHFFVHTRHLYTFADDLVSFSFLWDYFFRW
jgi:hypothetical protein